MLPPERGWCKSEFWAIADTGSVKSLARPDWREAEGRPAEPAREGCGVKARSARPGGQVTGAARGAPGRETAQSQESSAGRQGGTFCKRLPGGPSGGRYWDRTSDLFGVNEALSR
jgi:hypothetical protein